MKLVTDNRNVQSFGMMDETQFTITSGPHMMAILSGLYSRPEEAIVREYSTNMYDAWLALKRQNPNAKYIPGRITFPTALTPVMEFKDFGVGMDYDMVWKVYTSYGSSTKTGSNDEVGGFGLGSKTAFCYNNGQQWTIQSRYNGKLMTFMAFVAPNGVPTMTHVSTVDTTEHNGVTIQIPVKREDVQKFVDAGKKVLPYFPMELEVVNLIVPKIQTKYDLTVQVDGVDFPVKVYQRDTSYTYGAHARSAPSMIVMGNVPYPVSKNVDIDQMPDLQKYIPKASQWDRTSLWQSVFSVYVFDVSVPIGSVDIVPSREELKFTPRTIDLLRKLYGQIGLAILDCRIEEINQAKTRWDFFVLATSADSISRLLINNSVLTKFKGVTTNGLYLVPSSMWNGADVLGFSLSRDGVLSEVTLGEAYLRNNKDIETANLVFTTTMADVEIRRVVRAYSDRYCISRGANGRKRKTGHRAGTFLVVRGKTPAEISTMFGGYPEKYVHNLADHAHLKPVVQKTRKGKVGFYRLVRNKWEARIILPKGTSPVYFVPLKKGNHFFSYDGLSIEQLKFILDHFNIKYEDIYGVREDELANVPSHWHNVETIILDSVKKNFSTYDAKNKIVHDMMYYTNDDNHLKLHSLHKVFGTIPNSKKISDWAEVSEIYVQMQKALTDGSLAALRVFLQKQNKVDLVAKSPDNYNKTTEKFFATYPMITAFTEISNTYYGFTPAEPLVKKFNDYISLVINSKPGIDHTVLPVEDNRRHPLKRSDSTF